MLKNLMTAAGIFVLVIIALHAGQNFFAGTWQWFQSTTGLIIHDIADVWRYTWFFVSHHWLTVLCAFILTALICSWLFKPLARHADIADETDGELRLEAQRQRKTAIILAVLLGWLGIHRFYLNQIWTGFLYMLITVFFPVLTVLLSLVDACRYYSMSDGWFMKKFRP